MNILVIGSGGREHALVWKIKQSPLAGEVFCAPGNAGIASLATCVPIKADDFSALADFAEAHDVGLTVVGPEVPLAEGIVDFFNSRSLSVFGPDKRSARLEASKVFAKDLMQKYGVPTALYRTFTSAEHALEYLKCWPKDKPLVVKADGLAAGKGVIICRRPAEAVTSIVQIMKDEIFGAAGNEIIIEEFLEGEEVSLQIFLDGPVYRLMLSAQDHKRVNDNDDGPNTGGMGAYSPAPLFDEALRAAVEKTVIAPLLEGMIKEGLRYKGILYIGLMVCGGKPYVLEFNCRFGDPETQVVLPLLKSDLVDIMLKINQGELDKAHIEWYNSAAVCVIAASGGYPGGYVPGKLICGLADAAQLKDVIVFHAGTALKDGAVVTSGGRVLGITGLGKTIPDAITTAYTAVRMLSFEGLHYRKDIGQKALKRQR